jgi:hypothetical protein
VEPHPVTTGERSWHPDATRIAVLATVASVLAFVVFWQQGTVLGYKDSLSHLLIGRRVLVGQTTGLGQLGGVWLPLQHVLIMTLAWNDTLYLTGLAGSVFSMLCYVATCVGLHRVLHLATGSRAAGWAGAAVFGLAADVLYLQATPMGEPLMYAGMVWAVLAVGQWQREGRTSWLFIGAGLCALLVLVRYEAWVFSAAMWCVVLQTCVAQRRRFWRGDQSAQGLLLVFGFYMGAAVVAWLLWNQVIFGDWMGWLSGTYGSRDLTARLELEQVGSWRLSLLTYAWGAAHVVSWPFLATGLVGLVLMAARERFSSAFSVFAVTLVPSAFLVYGLWSGSQPMRVVEVDGDLYNLRMAVVLLVPAALFTGYLVAQLPPRAPGLRVLGAGLVVAIGSAGLAVAWHGGGDSVVTEVEAAEAWRAYEEQREVGVWVAEQTRGRVLVESIFNEWVVFPNQDRVVYEGSQDAWTSGLTAPAAAASDIDVVVMRTTPGDEDSVHDALYDTHRLSGFGVVLQTDNFLVLEKGAPGDAVRTRQ